MLYFYNVYVASFNHNLPTAKVDLYAGFHWNTLDTPSNAPVLAGGNAQNEIEDIIAVVVGSKLKFD